MTHTVRIFAYPSGTVLRTASVTNSGGNYSYTSLGTPLSVSTGDVYVVAVQLNRQNSGEECQGYYFPESSKGIQILGTCTLRNSANMPTNLITNTMFGTADSQFQPCAFAGEVSASENYVSSGASTQISVLNAIGSLTWQISSDGTNFSNISGQSGTQLTTDTVTQDQYYRIIANSGSCYATSSIVKVAILDPNYPLQAQETQLIAQEQNWGYNSGSFTTETTLTTDSSLKSLTWKALQM